MDGTLLEYLATFLCFTADSLTNLMQHMFTSPFNIDDDEEYKIFYSPGIIFSGDVPALDTDFFRTEKKEKDYKTVSRTTYGKVGFYSTSNYSAEDFYGNITRSAQLAQKIDYYLTTYGHNAEGTNQMRVSYSKLPSKEVEGIQLYDYTTIIPWITEDGKKYSLVVEGTAPDTFTMQDDKEYAFYTISMDLTDGLVKAEYQSSAEILQPIIVSWYKALRAIALVGLLSVLLYIGIRIVLSSSSAEDSAKYKSMLKDWLVAVCLLFTLHGIMNFTVIIVKDLTDLLAVSIVDGDGSDILLTTLRNRIATGDGWPEVMVEVVMYNVITAFTIIFTIQYIRRLVYLAFLTMIAPVITLTYPLDKIKDSKAQAFDTWLKDYVFFSLLQVLHLLLYYIFIGSSMDMANSGNWIYALVTIGFLTTAEKIMKKMFGFEKSKSMGAITAAASGALIMNSINKIKEMTQGSGSKKDKTSGGEQTKPVRTTEKEKLPGLGNNNGGAGDNGATQRQESTEGGAPRTQENPADGAAAAFAQSGNGQESGTPANLGGGQTPSTKPKRNIRGGLGAVGKKYIDPGFSRGIRAASGAFIGLAGGAIGLAAGIAQGDIKSAVAGAAGGFAAGRNIGEGAANGLGHLIDGIPNADKPIREIRDTFRKGAEGGDE